MNNRIESALNDQIKKEASSSQYYLSMASWAESNGLNGTASFMYTHSDEERFPIDVREESEPSVSYCLRRQKKTSFHRHRQRRKSKPRRGTRSRMTSTPSVQDYLNTSFSHSLRQKGTRSEGLQQRQLETQHSQH